MQVSPGKGFFVNTKNPPPNTIHVTRMNRIQAAFEGRDKPAIGKQYMPKLYAQECSQHLPRPACPRPVLTRNEDRHRQPRMPRDGIGFDFQRNTAPATYVFRLGIREIHLAGWRQNVLERD